MLDAQELNHHSSAAQILALEFITVATVKMLELAVQVNSNTSQISELLKPVQIDVLIYSSSSKLH